MFVSESITPEPGSFLTDMMRTGLASPPGAFTWRGDRYEVVDILDHRKVSSREGAWAQGELYLRRQEFTVILDTGQTAVLYVERQARAASRESGKKRWFLYTITSSERDGEDTEDTSGGPTGP